MTAIGDTIQPGESIPPDVTEVDDADGDQWLPDREPDRWACRGSTLKDRPSVWVSTQYGPLTVTAVREQPAAESVSGLCEVGADRVTCIVVDADHRRIYHGGSTLGDVATTLLAAEPESVDVLDLVRQHGDMKFAIGCELDGGSVEGFRAQQAKADALFARIEAEVNRLHDEAARLESDNLRLKRIQKRTEAEDLQVIGERDEAQDWADRLSQAIAEHLGVDIGEHSNANLPWQAALIALEERQTAADPSSPLVLRLPEVPEGAVALVGVSTGWRYVPWGRGGMLWHSDDAEGGTEPGTLGALLEAEGRLRVVMAPPREPRTWPKLDDGDPGDVLVIRGASGQIWQRNPLLKTLWQADNGARVDSFPGLQALDGPLVEVFDDKDGTR